MGRERGREGSGKAEREWGRGREERGDAVRDGARQRGREGKIEWGRQRGREGYCEVLRGIARCFGEVL
jgi:hypothetical protein